MNTKLYVGNLSFDINESGLRDLFTPFGQVSEAALILDRDTQRPRGFAFVTMGSKEEMDAAIAGLHGKTVDGRNLVVNEARARGDR
jgi:cold-inducible RNA-binding protein